MLPIAAALAVAALAGLIYSAAFPGTDIWPLAFVGLGLLLTTLRDRSPLTGALVGLVFGITFWFSLIDWVALFLGPLPLIALGGLQALLVAAGCSLTATVYRAALRLWTSPSSRIILTPALVAATWATREVVAGTWPYGGFAWGRFAFSQTTSPFAPLISWVGNIGTGALLVAVTAAAVAVLLEPRNRLLPRRPADLPVRLVAAAAPAMLLTCVPLYALPQTGMLRVAAVQPNSNAGYFDPDNDPTRNLDSVTAATLPAIGRDVDLIVWPEGAAHYDPLQDTPARNRLDQVSRAAAAPILTGAITTRGTRTYNSSVLWEPDRGVTAVYDKVRPVPFGEYVPDRAFWTTLAPTLLAQIGRDYTIGTRSPVLELDDIRIAVNICFDVVDDGLLLGAAAEDPQVLIGQTNNADFGRTDENQQQLAIARTRALESGRAFINTSTVASTAVIDPTGQTLTATRPFTMQTLIADVPLVSGTTPATTLGTTVATALSVLGVLLPLLLRTLTRSSPRTPTTRKRKP